MEDTPTAESKEKHTSLSPKIALISGASTTFDLKSTLFNASEPARTEYKTSDE